MTSEREIQQMLARISTPKAMVCKLWDGESYGPNSVKVVCVDAGSLDTLRYSDAWVEQDEDVKVGDSHAVSISRLGEIKAQPGVTSVVITGLMQLSCESESEMLAWVDGLQLLQRVLASRGGGPAAQPEPATAAAEAEEVDEDVPPVEDGEDEDDEQVLELQRKIEDLQRKIAQQYAMMGDAAMMEDDEDEEAAANQLQMQHEADVEEEEEEIVGATAPTIASAIPVAPPRTATAANVTVSAVGESGNTFGSSIEDCDRKDRIISELCDRIERLQADNDSKNDTIMTLSKRLEHSLKMLKAVHAMYEQQQQVLQAQEAVIDEMDQANLQIQAALAKKGEAVPDILPPTVFAPAKRQPAVNKNNIKPADTTPTAAPTRKMSAGLSPNKAKPAQGFTPSRQPQAKQAPTGPIPQVGSVRARSPSPARKPPVIPTTKKPEQTVNDLEQVKNLEGSIAEMMGLMQKIESIKGMLGGVEEMVNGANGEAVGLEQALLGGGGELQPSKPPVLDVDSIIGSKADVKQALLGAGREVELTEEATAEELAQYLSGLESLENEKASMQNQLLDAQRQQSEMLKRLEDMKKLMNMLGQATGEIA